MSSFDDKFLQGSFPQVDPYFEPPNSPGEPQKNSSNIMDLIKKLRNYNFFSEMSDKEIIWILRLCGRSSYKSGEVIFREGDFGSCFYLIVNGEVTIHQGEAEIARLGMGECFGEMSVLDEAPRSATAKAANDTLLISVERDILVDVLPTLGFKVAANLARQLSVKLRETDKLLKEALRQAAS